MSVRSQSGYTLVELIIALTITASVMAGLSGVVFGANLISGTWGQRTYLAQTTQLLPNRLQVDAHHYVPCSGQPVGGELHLCLPGGPEMVTYTAGTGCPCDLVRTDRQVGSSTVVVRGLQAPPTFSATCSPSGGVDAGSISLTLKYHGDSSAQPPVQVFFRAPLGSCGP